MAVPKKLTGRILDGSNNPISGVVQAQMKTLAFVNNGEVVPRVVLAIADATGNYAFDPAAAVPNGLYSNADMTPANSYWTIQHVAGGVPYPSFAVVIPNTAGPFAVTDPGIVVSSPALPAQYVIAGAAGIAAADGTIVIGGTVPAPTVKVGTIAQGQVTGLPAIAASQVTDEAAIAANTAAVALRAIKPLVGDATLYVSASGSDANDGLSAGSAKLTIQAAIAALPQQGGQSVGKVIVGLGTYTVASTGRTATVTMTSGSTTILDPSCTSADVGAYLGGYSGGGGRQILTVNAGVSFTVNIAPTSSGSKPVFMTKPAIYVPAGVTIQGAGATYAPMNVRVGGPGGGGILSNRTVIKDTGTGVTVLVQSAENVGPINASAGITLRDLAVWGNPNNMVGLCSMNGMWMLVVDTCDFSYHGWAGVGMGDAMCQSEFRSCIFQGNGTVGATKPTGGVLMFMATADPLASIVFTNCMWNNNYGIGLGAGAPYFNDGVGFSAATGPVLIGGQFNAALTTAIAADSGTHCWLNRISEQGTSSIYGTGFYGFCINNLISDGPLVAIGATFGGPANSNNVVLRSDGFSAIGCFFGLAPQSVVANGHRFSWMGCSSIDTMWSGSIPASAATGIGTAGGTFSQADMNFQVGGVASNALNLHNNASAVNGLQITGTATTVAPILSPIGDATVGLVITGKGNSTASGVQILSPGAAAVVLELKAAAGQTERMLRVSSSTGTEDIAFLRTDGNLALASGLSDIGGTNHIYLVASGLYMDGKSQVVMRDGANANAAIGTFTTAGAAIVGGAGFWGHAVQPSKPAVTGSRSANAALASLLTALAATGILTDSSTV